MRRLAAWLVACARNRRSGLFLVIGFATAHVALWTLILIKLKAAQDIHMDVAEAFGWGQKFQLGYGKHPPLAGWIHRFQTDGRSDSARMYAMRVPSGDHVGTAA